MPQEPTWPVRHIAKPMMQFVFSLSERTRVHACFNLATFNARYMDVLQAGVLGLNENVVAREEPPWNSSCSPREAESAANNLALRLASHSSAHILVPGCSSLELLDSDGTTMVSACCVTLFEVLW